MKWLRKIGLHASDSGGPAWVNLILDMGLASKKYQLPNQIINSRRRGLGHLKGAFSHGES